MNCACGQPLHYSSAETQKHVEDIIKEFGEFVEIVMGGQRYKAQRHYIALHGLKAQELEELASLGIIEKIYED